MTIFDRLILLLAGLIAIYLIVHFYRSFYQSDGKARFNLYYLAAFAVLLAAGLLLIALGYGILANPLVVIVSTLLPALLATGLVAQIYPRSESGYLIFAAIGFLSIAITQFTGPFGLATAILATVHSVFGLTIFFLPIVASFQHKTNGSFIWVTVGGTLIGVGGIALAFLKAGKPILSQQVILTILAPLLLLMMASYAWGFVSGVKDQA